MIKKDRYITHVGHACNHNWRELIQKLEEKDLEDYNAWLEILLSLNWFGKCLEKCIEWLQGSLVETAERHSGSMGSSGDESHED